uniref:Uncharacterized protein n=1 Tax=Parastrongyloides trichosuri TaxID=131310 RepID=A0A0N4ZFD0_PARTI
MSTQSLKEILNDVTTYAVSTTNNDGEEKRESSFNLIRTIQELKKEYPPRNDFNDIEKEFKGRSNIPPYTIIERIVKNQNFYNRMFEECNKKSLEFIDNINSSIGASLCNTKSEDQNKNITNNGVSKNPQKLNFICNILSEDIDKLTEEFKESGQTLENLKELKNKFDTYRQIFDKI